MISQPEVVPEAARRMALVAAGGTIVIGLAGLIGWLLSLPVLTSFVPGLATMKFNTAIGLALLGLALVSSLRERAFTPVTWIPAGAAIVIGSATAMEYVLGRSFGIDELVLRDPSGGLQAGRVSPVAAGALISSGIAILLLSGRRAVRPGLAAGVVTLAAAVTSLVGYLFGATDLYRLGPFNSISLPTAIGFTLLGVGIVAGHPPDAVRRGFGPGPGGQLIRRLLPAAVAAPIGLGFAALAGTRAGWFAESSGLALLVVGLMATLLLLTFRTAAAVDRTDDERRRIEAEARRASEREQVVALAVADAIVTIDADSIIRYANPAADRIFEHPPGSLVGRSLTALMPQRFHAQHLAGFRRYIESGVRTIAWEGTELIGRRSGGEEFPIDVSFAESFDGSERSFTGIIRDVSTRKRLESQLLQAQRLESVGRLAGGVAHDFNNILTAMLGFAQLVLDDLPADDPRRADVAAIREGGERAGTLVRQLLAFSRRQVLRPETVRLVDVVDGILPMVARLIGSDIEIVRGRMELGAVRADRGQLEQVIVNLAVNARDAMPRGGRLTIEVTSTSLPAIAESSAAAPHLAPGPYVRLTVSDTGSGMSAETRAHVFEPFFTTKGDGLGTGLGLATVYGIVEQSGGQIAVYSEPGHGSTFRILLPEDTSGARAEPAAPPIRAASLGRGQHILVVEDEAAIRDLIRRVLTRDGYEVTLAEDATVALTHLANGGTDLVLSDVVMPGMSGLDLAREIHARQPALPIVLMTGYSAAALASFEIDGRAPTILEKPFTPEALLETVHGTLERSSSA